LIQPIFEAGLFSVLHGRRKKASKANAIIKLMSIANANPYHSNTHPDSQPNFYVKFTALSPWKPLALGGAFQTLGN
jgi:hypothetical protein